MPLVLQTRSSQNSFKRKINGKLVSYSQQTASIEETNLSSELVSENSQHQPTMSKESRRRSSSVIETERKKTKNDDDLPIQTEKSDENDLTKQPEKYDGEDLVLPRNFRQTNENSGKILPYDLSEG